METTVNVAIARQIYNKNPSIFQENVRRRVDRVYAMEKMAPDPLRADRIFIEAVMAEQENPLLPAAIACEAIAQLFSRAQRATRGEVANILRDAGYPVPKRQRTLKHKKQKEGSNDLQMSAGLVLFPQGLPGEGGGDLAAGYGA